MSLSIQGGGDAAGARLLQQALAARQNGQERLASGRRIARAADDSAGLAIAKRLEAQVRGAAQAERNLADGRDLVRTADASLQTSQDTIARMRELTVQAQNGTLSASDREVVQQEYDQLAAQLDQTARGTNFAGRTLLDGSLAGAGSLAITDGEGGDTEVAIGDASAAGLGVQGRAVGDPSSLAALDDARDLLAGERARLGAIDNTLGTRQQQLAAERVSSEQARSRIEDVDVAREVAESTRNRILAELTLSGQRVGNHDRGRVLELLTGTGAR